MTSAPAPSLTRCEYCGRQYHDGRRICCQECAAALAEIRRLDIAAMNQFAEQRRAAARAYQRRST